MTVQSSSTTTNGQVSISGGACQRGFIALISILILSVALLATVISLAQYGITTRYALLDLERKAASESLAEACIQVARIAIVNDPDSDCSSLCENPVSVGDTWCDILSVSVSVSGSESIVEVNASSTGATTNLEATIEHGTGDITKIEEVPGF